MAEYDSVYFDYQLMNETFTSVEKRSAESLLLDRFDPKPFDARDTRGRRISFLIESVTCDEEKFYAYLLPMAKILGRKEGTKILFEMDRKAVPFTMRAVTDKEVLESVEKMSLEAVEHQKYRINNFREWLMDIESDEPLQLMCKPGVSVGFKRLAAIERDGDVYVVIQPMDNLELFDKGADAVFVYKCDDKVSPPSFLLAEKSVARDILREYYGASGKKNAAAKAPSDGVPAYDDFFETTSFVPADERNIYDILLVVDEEDLRKPFTLKDGAGREMTFVTEAVWSDDFTLYAVLNPVSEIKGCDSDTEIMFFVDDEVTPPVLRVETDEVVCDDLFDEIDSMFNEDEEILLTYPAAWEVIFLDFEGIITFCKGADGVYHRFECVYSDKSRPDKMYAVLCALTSDAGFKKGVEYVFSIDNCGDLKFGEPTLVTDREVIARVMRDRKWRGQRRGDASRTLSDASGPLFTCRKCWAEYRGDACPTCGTERKHKDYLKYPSCTYLDPYSDTYCRDYVLWEDEGTNSNYIKRYVRCGKEPYEDPPCLLWFRLSGDGYVVTGMGGCVAEHLSIPSKHDGKPVVGIESRAFAKSALSYVLIPDTVKFIGASAFEGCRNLEFIRLNAVVPKIEERTFADCPKFRGLSFSGGLETIGKEAFSGCSSIRELQFSETLAAIEKGAFDGCSSLGEVYYEGNAEMWERIGIAAEGNDNLLRARIYFYSKEKPVTAGRFWHYSPDKYAFRTKWQSYRDPVTDCSAYVSNEYLPTYGLKYRDTKDGYVVIGRGRCAEKNIVIPPTHRGRKVVAVDKKAFMGDDVMRNLVVGENVGKIGVSAFQDCANLRGVIILSDVKKMEDMVFSGCRELAYLVIPESCETIGRHVFDDCDLLTIYFKGNAEKWDGVKIDDENEDWLFDGECVCFYSETKPKPVKGHWHYSEKFKPTKWTGAQKGPKPTGEKMDAAAGGVIRYPFDPATNLPQEEVLLGDAEDENFPHGLEFERFGKCCAVSGMGICEDLKEELVLPSMYNGLRVAAVAASAFKDCRTVTSVAVPDGAVSIDDEAFMGCARLSEVNIPGTVERIGNLAFSSTGLETAVIPESARHHLGKSAFANCARLRSVVFGELIFIIPSCAFSGCAALEYVVLPRYVDRIEAGAFEGCSSLKALFYPSTEKEYKRLKCHVEKTDNVCFLSATMYFYSEERPEKPGNFWHYDENGNPVIWEEAL